MNQPLRVEAIDCNLPSSVEIRVRGRVQGVGFRPTVWRLADELGLTGEVANDSEGVIIRVSGLGEAIAALIRRLHEDRPPLAIIDSIESRLADAVHYEGFRIVTSIGGAPRTQVAPDAVTCADCAREVLGPGTRRYRYPFANCTHCGPRLSIVTGLPYGRSSTTMGTFPMCAACAAEYRAPADRRFHAEAIACPECGPTVRLMAFGVQGGIPQAEDAIEAAAKLLLAGRIVAVKGLGGYQLACDATNAEAVLRLRNAKQRPAKPFALMARDLDIVRRYCTPSVEERAQLTGTAGPIVLMPSTGPEHLPGAVAPGLRTLGFMLPTTPLHLLLTQRIDRPLIMTSGNLSDEPQIVDDDEARTSLSGIADYALVHDRRIAIRVDDSVLRVLGGAPLLLRRARGYAPAIIKLPAGFEAAPPVLAMGGDLKSAFCLIRDGEALLSQHQGNLEHPAALEDFLRNQAFYAERFGHTPTALAADQHPDYRSSKLARARAGRDGLPLLEIQHHHAHVAACLAENGRPLAAPPVLGIVLDGLGWGTDGTIWGGEFLLADYCRSERLATFKPVPMLGGDQAAREPWRNLYAHLLAETSWAELDMNFGELELYRYLAAKPRRLLDGMIKSGLNSPLASSCGRLFDAVAAALGICRDRQMYEGEAASRLEGIVDEKVLREEPEALVYPFTIPNLRRSGLPYLEPVAMWKALLGDLILQTPAPVVAARFHKGLARGIAAMADKLARRSDGPRFDTVALSGGCFQNAVLFGEVVQRLHAIGFTVVAHRQVPANDGGLALGQGVVASARLVAGMHA